MEKQEIIDFFVRGYKNSITSYSATDDTLIRVLVPIVLSLSPQQRLCLDESLGQGSPFHELISDPVGFLSEDKEPYPSWSSIKGYALHYFGEGENIYQSSALDLLYRTVQSECMSEGFDVYLSSEERETITEGKYSTSFVNTFRNDEVFHLLLAIGYRGLSQVLLHFYEWSLDINHSFFLYGLPYFEAGKEVDQSSPVPMMEQFFPIVLKYFSRHILRYLPDDDYNYHIPTIEEYRFQKMVCESEGLQELISGLDLKLVGKDSSPF